MIPEGQVFGGNSREITRVIMVQNSHAKFKFGIPIFLLLDPNPSSKA